MSSLRLLNAGTAAYYTKVVAWVLFLILISEIWAGYTPKTISSLASIIFFIICFCICEVLRRFYPAAYDQLKSFAGPGNAFLGTWLSMMIFTAIVSLPSAFATTNFVTVITWLIVVLIGALGNLVITGWLATSIEVIFGAPSDAAVADAKSAKSADAEDGLPALPNCTPSSNGVDIELTPCGAGDQLQGEAVPERVESSKSHRSRSRGMSGARPGRSRKVSFGVSEVGRSRKVSFGINEAAKSTKSAIDNFVDALQTEDSWTKSSKKVVGAHESFVELLPGSSNLSKSLKETPYRARQIIELMEEEGASEGNDSSLTHELAEKLQMEFAGYLEVDAFLARVRIAASPQRLGALDSGPSSSAVSAASGPPPLPTFDEVLAFWMIVCTLSAVVALFLSAGKGNVLENAGEAACFDVTTDAAHEDDPSYQAHKYNFPTNGGPRVRSFCDCNLGGGAVFLFQLAVVPVMHIIATQKVKVWWPSFLPSQLQQCFPPVFVSPLLMIVAVAWTWGAGPIDGVARFVHRCPDAQFAIFQEGYFDAWGPGYVIQVSLTPAIIVVGFQTSDRMPDVQKYLPKVIPLVFASLIISSFSVAVLAGAIIPADEEFVALSMLPHTVTTAVAIGFTEFLERGTHEAHVAIVAATSVFGPAVVMIVGRPLLDFARIRRPVARGVAMGTAGSALGVLALREAGEETATGVSAVAYALFAVYAMIVFSIKSIGLVGVLCGVATLYRD